jgi:hypothetical protein
MEAARLVHASSKIFALVCSSDKSCHRLCPSSRAARSQPPQVTLHQNLHRRRAQPGKRTRRFMKLPSKALTKVKQASTCPKTSRQPCLAVKARRISEGVFHSNLVVLLMGRRISCRVTDYTRTFHVACHLGLWGRATRPKYRAGVAEDGYTLHQIDSHVLLAICQTMLHTDIIYIQLQLLERSRPKDWPF